MFSRGVCIIDIVDTGWMPSLLASHPFAICARPNILLHNGCSTRMDTLCPKRQNPTHAADFYNHTVAATAKQHTHCQILRLRTYFTHQQPPPPPPAPPAPADARGTPAPPG